MRGAIIVDQLLAADLSTPLRPVRNTGLRTYLPCITGERSYVGSRQRDTRMRVRCRAWRAILRFGIDESR